VLNSGARFDISATCGGTTGAVRLALSALSCPMRAQVLLRQRTAPGQGGGDRFATSEGPQVRTHLRPPGPSSKNGSSPAETRLGTVFGFLAG